MPYNPIIRNYCRLRCVLVHALGLPRHAVHPSAKLVDLIPRPERRRVWVMFQNEKLDTVELTMSKAQWASSLVLMLAWTVAGCLVWPSGFPVILLTSLMLGLAILSFLFRFCAREIPRWLTVGDLVLAATSERECREAAYTFSRNEIYLKVRMCLALAACMDPSEITPETTFHDLGLE